MAWRVAQSLNKLLDQINAGAPHRSKLSDGSIGNAEHAARTSDHNPWVKDGNVGVVTARDFTHDPAGGFDSYRFADNLVARGDSRIKYVISNGRIASGTGQDHPAWQWRKYTGANKHDHHVHVSVKSDKASYDSLVPWSIVLPAVTRIEPSSSLMKFPLLKSGDSGESVKTLQKLLSGKKFYNGLIDGIFGKATKKAVTDFQKSVGLGQDGVVGTYTWAKLNPPSVTITTPPATLLVNEETWFSSPFPPVSEYGLQWGRTFERFEADAYPDPTPDKAAQGFGHNAVSGIPPIPVIGGAPWTQEYAEEVYKNDVAIRERYLNYYVKVPLAQRMIDALVLDIYKLGSGNFKKDKVLEALNSGDYGAASKALRERPSALRGVRRRYGVLADIFDGMRPDQSIW